MSTIIKDEARDDDNNEYERRVSNNNSPPSRLPKTIHCGPAFQTSNLEPTIIEDMTGYEVIHGRFQIFVGRGVGIGSMPDSLVHGEPIESTLALEPTPKRVRIGGAPGRGYHPPSPSTHHHHQQQLHHHHINNNRKKETEIVTQAMSLLQSGSNMSEITFADEEAMERDDFKPERISL